MKKITFDVYGVTVQLTSPLNSFTEFVAENYSQFNEPGIQDPNIDVEFSQSAGRLALERKSDLQFFGSGISLDGESIYWENEFGFRVLVTLEDDTIAVRGFHDDLRGKSDTVERYKDFQRSMRWSIHFPIFTWFQYRRGWALVHSSAIVKDGDAIIFCGLNKVGKSTLATYLSVQHEYDFMTDNFLLVGDSAVYGFPEVLRLSPEAAKSLGLPSLWDERVYGKVQVAPDSLGVELEANPKAFFLINQGNTLITRKLNPPQAWETIERLHGYLGEFPEHSYLGFWPYLTGETIENESVSNTLTSTPWYELSYEPDWNLEAVASEIERCI